MPIAVARLNASGGPVWGSMQIPSGRSSKTTQIGASDGMSRRAMPGHVRRGGMSEVRECVVPGPRRGCDVAPFGSPSAPRAYIQRASKSTSAPTPVDHPPEPRVPAQDDGHRLRGAQLERRLEATFHEPDGLAHVTLEGPVGPEVGRELDPMVARAVTDQGRSRTVPWIALGGMLSGS